MFSSQIFSFLGPRGTTLDGGLGNRDASQTPVSSSILDVDVEMAEITEVSEPSIVEPDTHTDIAHNPNTSANDDPVNEGEFSSAIILGRISKQLGISPHCMLAAAPVSISTVIQAHGMASSGALEGSQIGIGVVYPN